MRVFCSECSWATHQMVNGQLLVTVNVRAPAVFRVARNAMSAYRAPERRRTPATSQNIADYELSSTQIMDSVGMPSSEDCRRFKRGCKGRKGSLQLG